jgi:hypothetical protein
VKRIYIISLLFLVWSTSLFAQDLKLTASLSSNEVSTGQQFQIIFTVNKNIDRFAPPDLSGFQVLSGPNQSTSMTSINGVTTSSMSLSYDLAASRPGVYAIGPATISVGGKIIRSNPLKLTVIKGNAPTQGNNSSAGQQAPSNSQDLSKRVFIRAIPNKTSVYQGEQITVAYKLYTNIDLLDNQVDKLPDFNGFWSQEIKETNQNVQWSIETYKGIRYQTAVIKQVILFPEHSGELSLDYLGMTFLVRAPVESSDPFDQLFGATKDVKQKTKSSAVVIHVKPLPLEGKPANFNGAVGNFSFSADLDKKELKANETLNYTLSISGSGNLKLMSAPVINPPEFFEKYDPKLTDQITESAQGVSGSRKYAYLLIPRKEGIFKLEPYRFTYFNPLTKRYVTLTSSSFQVKVNKGAPGSDPVPYASNNQQDVKALGKDILYIKTTAPSFSKKGKFYNSIAYYLLLCLGPVLFLSSLAYKKKQDKDNSDLVKLKSKYASKLAAKHLASAQQQLSLGDKKAFYEELYKGLYGYLSDKLNITAALLNQENIISKLRDTSVAEPVISSLVNTLNDCEMARYAPVQGKDESNVFENAKNIIKDIEQYV